MKSKTTQSIKKVGLIEILREEESTSERENPKSRSCRRDEIAKKIPTTLFHYDSVYNTIQFIRHGSLLSRNYMMQKGIPLTPQLSDIIDIEQNIFDSIF